MIRWLGFALLGSLAWLPVVLADGPYFVNGNLENGTAGFTFKAIKAEIGVYPDPKHDTNHAIRYSHISGYPSDEKHFVDLEGHIHGIVTKQPYTVIFQYMFEQDVEHVWFGVEFFALPCRCGDNAFDVKNERYPRSVKAMEWNTYSGTLIGSVNSTGNVVHFNIQPDTRHYSGYTYLDNFAVLVN